MQLLTTTLAISILLSLTPNITLAEEQPPLTKHGDKLIANLAASSVTGSLDYKGHATDRLIYVSPGIKLTYFIKSNNIIEIVTDSIVTKDAKKWNITSPSRINTHGNAASFIVEQEGDFLDTIHQVKVEGTVDLQTGTKPISKSFTLPAIGTPLRVDDFVFTLLADKLKIEGNPKLIKEVSVIHNGSEIDPGRSTTTDVDKTFTFLHIGEGAKVNFTYWAGVITKKVHFSK